MKQVKPWLVVVAMAVALAACGGGGGDSNTPTQDDPLAALPKEATESVAGWIGFLITLTAVLLRGEDKEPFEISSTGVLSVPGDDTAEPMTLNP
jgi:hypothetical protein